MSRKNMEGLKPSVRVFPQEECAICLREETSLIVFLDCGHACVCKECDDVHKLLSCPLDQQPIAARTLYVKGQTVDNSNVNAERIEVMPRDFLITKAEFITRHDPQVERKGQALIVSICHAYDFQKGVVARVFDEYFSDHRGMPTNLAVMGTQIRFEGEGMIKRDNVVEYKYPKFFQVYPRASVDKLRNWIISAYYGAYRDECSRRAAAGEAPILHNAN